MTLHSFESRPNRAAPAEDQRLLKSFSSYGEAQQLVDRMSDGGFPVEHVRIIGDDLQTVEQVTGRLTNAKAALAGAGSGAWFGLFVGLVVGLFAVGTYWLWILFFGLVIGAVWGAIFGFFAHWATRGRRDFSSVQTLQARRYDVYVDTSQAAEAARFVA
jgi:hypothetical protein